MEKNYEEIVRYAKGEMDEASRKVFEQKMQADAELAKEARFYRDAAQVFQMKGLLDEVESDLEADQFFSKLDLPAEEEGGRTDPTLAV